MSLIKVTRRNNESFQKMMRRFKNKVEDSNVLREFREKMYFMKPSVRKRRKSMLAQARVRKEEAKAKRLEDIAYENEKVVI